MKRILLGLLNPFALALWVTFLIMLIFPLQIDKYIARVSEKGIYTNNSAVWYDDLDGDGNSEKIDIFHNSLGTAAVTISNANGVLDQWTFRGRYDFAQTTGLVVTGDRDKDSIREVYVFTLAHDSVLLQIIQNYKQPGDVVKNRFIARVNQRDKKVDPFMIAAEMDDLTQDGSDELIFGIGTGYSLSPRKVFAYDAVNDTLLLSPESNYFISGILQDDINGDGIDEIIPYGYAASNARDSAVPYPDWDSWLMVLNHKLEFVFQPLDFPGQFSRLKPVVVEKSPGEPVLIAYYCPPENKGDSNLILQMNQSGQVTGKLTVPWSTNDIHAIRDRHGKEWLLVNGANEGIYVYDASLALHKVVPAVTGERFIGMDIDLDGVDEIISDHRNKRQIIIYRNELNHPVFLDFDGRYEKGLLYSVKAAVGKPPQLYFQFGFNYFLYDYGFNPHYNYRFLYFAAVYISVLLFTGLVRKLQHDQIQRKYNTEKRITDLQLQIVRNQLDPHFVMNAINSIIASIGDKGKEEARQQLLHFSRLNRSLLLSSNTIQRSLGDEIEFTENYLALEKFRFMDRFDYDVYIDPQVDQEIQVPKMIIQIHVENALKHGILPLERKGRLSVSIIPVNGSLQVDILDDGVGRQFARENGPKTTGKGLLVMEQYVKLFNKYYPDRIATRVEDLYDARGNPGGTKIRITINGI